MFLNPTKRRLQIWIACFAILMNALAPSLSHAFASGDDPLAPQICRPGATVASSPELAAMILAAAVADADAADSEHCAYCLPHAGADALMPVLYDGLGILGGHALRPFLFYRAPQPLLALIAAAPRGPPSLA